jgi:hypothetical protein
MTTGAKVAIILGSATLLIGGGIGIYFLTKKKETLVSKGGATTSTTTSGNKILDTANKVGETAETVKETVKQTTESVKGLVDTIGGLFNKDKEKKTETKTAGTLSDGTTVFNSKSATGDENMSQKQMLKTYGIVTC